MEQRVVTPEQEKWVAKLVRFNYEIKYWLGKTNATINSLSRTTLFVARSTGDHAVSQAPSRNLVLQKSSGDCTNIFAKTSSLKGVS